MTMQQELIPCKTEGCTLKHQPKFDVCYQCSRKAKGYIVCGVDGCTQLKDPGFPTCYNHNQRQPANKQQVATPETQVSTQYVERIPHLLSEEDIKTFIEMRDTMQLLDLTTKDVADQLEIDETEAIRILNLMNIAYAVKADTEVKTTVEAEPVYDAEGNLVEGLEELPWN